MFLLKLFGSLSLHCVGGSPPSAAQQKRRLGLLGLLAIGGDRGVSRDRLQAYLWPESPASPSRHALDQLVYATRRSLGRDPILSEGRDLRLDASVIGSDLREFEEAIRAEEWERAAAIYGGPLLDGFHLSDSRELESWIDGERDRLAQQHQRVLETVARGSAAKGDHLAAVSWWRKLAASDPLSSRIAMAVVQGLADAGDRAGAIQHARNYQQLVRSELEVEPDPQIERTIAELAGPRVTEPVRTGRASIKATAAHARRIPEAQDRDNSAQAKVPRMAAAMAFLLILAVGSFAVLERARGDSLGSEPGRKRTPIGIHPDAKAAYLRGLNSWNDRSKDGLDTAVIHFRRAIEIDPVYASAHAGLATAYVLLGYSGYRPADAMFPKAKAAALRAIDLDSTVAPAYAALGMELTWERDFRKSEAAFRRAISLDPSYATAHQWYGILLMILGRVPQAVAETRRAAELDPLSLQIQNNYATFLASSGEPAAALRHYQKVVGEEPDAQWVRRNPWLLTNLAAVYAANGQYEKAFRAAERAVEITPGHPRALSALAGIHNRAGRPDLARAVFARADTLNEHYAAYRALLHAQMGQTDSAFIWFDRVREWGIPIMISLQSLDRNTSLAADPRFDALLRRLGLSRR